jgi:thiamine-phosphate pyrophosphorylase
LNQDSYATEVSPITLPRLYCIIDAGCFADAPDPTARITQFARELIAGGATLIQYRNKSGNARQMLSDARELRRIVAAHSAATTLIMNDRADLCLAAGFDGVHVGQHDLSAAAARRILAKPLWVGVSTHTLEQVVAADATDCDYIAIGPAFATASKQNPDPVVGVDGVRRARAATRKPLVAIGGITRQNFRQVLDAGADSAAVIRDLLRDPRAAVEEFLAG